MEEDKFEEFWKAYPARKGDRAKGPARILFQKAVKSGVSADQIIDSAKRFALLEAEKVGTEFIMQAQRWLRNKRWVDFEFIPIDRKFTKTAFPGRVFIREDTEQWKAWQKVKKTPCVNFGWWFDSEWPPGHNP